jgi:hypothetical protein
MSPGDNLSGAWFGSYDYGAAAGAVTFIALIEEAQGALSGRISEPDTFKGTGGILGSVLSGARAKASVFFNKIYEPAAGGHAVRYSGSLNAEGTYIVGDWTIGLTRGRFVMTREIPGREEALEDEDALEAVR